MKRFLSLLSLLCGSALYASLPVPAIAQKPLDEFVVYEIPVADSLGNTTILFPSPISGIFASKAAPAIQSNSEFLIDYQPGGYYFTVRALKSHAEDYINVVFEKKAYVFHIFASKQPYRTLTLFYPSKSSFKGKKNVSPEVLISLLDKVKSYSILAAQHPEAVEGVLHDAPRSLFEGDSYKLVINDVYRFEESDTLIFRITLENKTSKRITYDPQNVSIGLKENLYSTSIVDASGDIPPNATVTAYFGITGTSTGSRNNLSPKNNWNVILLPDNAPLSPKDPNDNQDDKKFLKK